MIIIKKRGDEENEVQAEIEIQKTRIQLKSLFLNTSQTVPHPLIWSYKQQGPSSPFH